jgi:hypothetical protein
MSEGVVAGVELAEQIKWDDALDALTSSDWNGGGTERGVELARECQHPDARWLAALFPPGEAVTQERVREVMLEQGDDPRALHLASRLGLHDDSEAMTRRAAEMGYAPAQFSVAWFESDPVATVIWLEKAAAKNDRNAMVHLGRILNFRDSSKARGIELLRRAAEMNLREAQWEYGKLAFGSTEWERYHWWSQAVEGGFEEELLRDVASLLPSFERGECGRILHTVAPVVAQQLRLWKEGGVFVCVFQEGRATVAKFERVLDLHGAMLGRARRAVDCWSVAARRHGLVKDVRVMIAKMAWEEAWRWGEKEHAKEPEKATQPSVGDTE